MEFHHRFVKVDLGAGGGAGSRVDRSCKDRKTKHNPLKNQVRIRYIRRVMSCNPTHI